MDHFVVPVLFVLNPTRIVIGEPLTIAYDVITAIIAVWLLAAAEGWLFGSAVEQAGSVRSIAMRSSRHWAGGTSRL